MVFLCPQISHIAVMLIYNATKWIVRNGLRCYFRRLHIDGLQHIPAEGPALLVANHPNAFLDALMIAAFVERPIHFLARGDAFKHSVLAAIFRTFNMLPVYRISEGKENLGKNTETFDASHELLKKQGIVLIFGEGWCVQNWDLRPLKKGSARIAERAWGDPLTQNTAIIPIGLTYEHFNGGGKSVVMHIDKPIIRSDNNEHKTGASFVKWLNKTLTLRLQKLAYVNSSLQPESAEHRQFIHTWHHAEQKQLPILDTLRSSSDVTTTTSALSRLSFFEKTLVTLPHYWMMQKLSFFFTRETVFYDSVLFALIILLFPVYIGTVMVLMSMFL